jgi:hypothetical protein
MTLDSESVNICDVEIYMRVNFANKKLGGLIIFAVLIGILAASIALAQSQSAFSLNSPASFPVDI